MVDPSGKGVVVGYARVSSTDQHLDRQLESLREFGVDEIREEKASAAKGALRPVLNDTITYLRSGDTLVVSSWDRLARSVADLDDVIDQLNAKGVTVRDLKSGQVFSPAGTDAMTKGMRQIMAVFAEMERSIIKERQAEGITAAKAKGVYKGGVGSLTADEVERMKARVADGVPKAKVARDMGVSVSTIQRALQPGYTPRTKPRSRH